MTQRLLSVGIDIGTSTTQLVFCELDIENMASAWTVPRVRIVNKRVIYRSDIHFTPMINVNVLDAKGIQDIVTFEYTRAGIEPKQVKTGAVIITGEAARKKNAEDILNTLSGLAGDFVVTTAGPDLEGILAGKGSGACAYSKEHGKTVINFDIGGGTTNVAVYQNGDVVDSACYDIGGRLVKIDSKHRISYVSQKMLMLIEALKLNIRVGDNASEQTLRTLAKCMSECIVAIANGDREHPQAHLLITDHGLKHDHRIDYICLSGGVADCLDQSEDVYRYGDIGIILGQELKKALLYSGLSVFTAAETIRATVIGAGIHTTSISGSTINYDFSMLPLKNIPVIRLNHEEEHANGTERVRAIKRRFRWVVHEGEVPHVAISVSGSKAMTFNQLEGLATDMIQGMSPVIDKKYPLIVITDHDIGKSLGLCLRRHLPPHQPVVCLDSVVVDNGDYIDIGTPVADGQVLPVIIKTLLFGY